MKILVLHNAKGAQSANALVTALQGTDKNNEVLQGIPDGKRIKGREFDYIVNVGNSSIFIIIGKPTIINHPSKIAISANKRLARIRFKAKGIPAPILWLSAKEISKAEFPVIGRTTYHMKASGFWFCENMKEARSAELQGATHFIKFIKNTREFRAHVFSNILNPKRIEDYYIAKLSEKKVTTKTESSIIKNHDNGYSFLAPSYSDPKVIDLINRVSILTLQKFELHYGAVDIVYSKDNKQAYVLEINTTPCLTDESSTTATIYADSLLRLMSN